MVTPRRLLAIVLAAAGSGRLLAQDAFPLVPSIPFDGVTIARGDLNGDGNEDMVLNSKSGFEVRLNEGLLKYAVAGTYATSAPTAFSNDVRVTLVDLNGDGRLDVVTFLRDSGTDTMFVGVRLGDGAGGFGSEKSFIANFGLATFADVNADGMPDLVVGAWVAGIPGALEVRLGTGSESFGAPISVPSPNGIVHSADVGDLDGNGTLDVVAGRATTGWSVERFLGDGIGGFTLGAAIPTADHPNHVRLADMTSDGLTDIVVQTGHLGNPDKFWIEVIPSVAVGFFGAPVATPITSFPYLQIDVADANGDGKPDVLLADSNNFTNCIELRRGTGAGTFQPADLYAVNGLYAPYTAQFGHEADDDGWLDVYATSLSGVPSTPSKIWILRGHGANGLGAPRLGPANIADTAEAVGDVNGDGRPDLVSTLSFPPALTVQLGDGAGSFTFVWSVGFPFTPGRMELGDLNGDHKLDAVVVSASTDVVAVCLGDGAGHFGAPILAAAPSGPVDPKLIDLNNDGKLDVLCLCRAANVLAWLPGIGTGQLGSPVSWGVADHPTRLALGDFTSDGVLDVSVASETFSMVDVLKNTGGGFTVAATTVVSGPAHGLAVADLNGDGISDLVARVLSTQFGGHPDLQVLLGHSNGPGVMEGLSWHSDFLTQTIGGDVVIADFNGDTIPGVAANDATGGTLTIGMGTGTAQFTAPPSYASFGGSYVIESFPSALVAADVNSDGKQDLVAIVPGHSVTVLNQSDSPAGFVLFGSGTSGCSGKLGMSANGPAKINTSGFRFTATNAPKKSIGFGLVTNSKSVAGIDEFGVGILIHADLYSATATASFNFTTDLAGQAVSPVPMPNLPGLVGVTLIAQGIFAETSATGFWCTTSPFGFVSSMGLAFTIQN